jgi:hypothetical protein
VARRGEAKTVTLYGEGDVDEVLNGGVEVAAVVAG